jgi:hypothetical protein
MDHLFTKLLAHKHNQETNKAVDIVVANPILITMEDNELHLSLLQHALFNQAPFNVISTFVSHWLLLEDLHSLTEMQLMHLAWEHNATFDVICYLLALSPTSWKTRNSNGYTPFMLALSNKFDKDILYILDDSNVGVIGDFSGSGCAKNAVVKECFEDDFKRLDSQKTLFRLEHKDPTLKCLALADLFHSLYPEESDGSFNYSQHQKTVMDLLDAVKSFPHLEELILVVDRDDSILWREGNAHNALFSMMHDLPSKVIITI